MSIIFIRRKMDGMATKDEKIDITSLEQYLDLKNKDLNLKDILIYFGNM